MWWDPKINVSFSRQWHEFLIFSLSLIGHSRNICRVRCVYGSEEMKRPQTLRSSQTEEPRCWTWFEYDTDIISRRSDSLWFYSLSLWLVVNCCWDKWKRKRWVTDERFCRGLTHERVIGSSKRNNSNAAAAVCLCPTSGQSQNTLNKDHF